MLDAELLEVLACPACLARRATPPAGIKIGELELQGPAEQPAALRCRQCGSLYPVRDGIPDFMGVGPPDTQEQRKPETHA